MRYFAAFAAAALLVESVASTAWIPKSVRANKRNNNSPASKGFVTTQGGQFLLEGKPFFFLGTNAYWLMQLSDENIDLTLKSIAEKNITVVRTWAFNDVVEIPSSGAWFQHFDPNGTVTINTGPTGLQRLDKIMASAEANGIKVQLALTNNWNPARPANTTTTLLKRDNNTSNVTHPPGSLSNDYGGIDAYVRAHKLEHHDQFYTNQTLIDAFTNYLNVVIPRYKNNTALVAWELANDARCNSTLPHSGKCQAQDITKWHNTVSQTVKELDPNHLVSSGTQGQFCVGCPKLFLKPSPQPSPLPGQKKRATGPLTAKRVLAQRQAKAKRNEEAIKKRSPSDKWQYRGKVRDMAHGKRQITTQAMGPAFDGAQGVDSEDILAIPQIAFGTFALFPDQNTYGPLDPTLDFFNNTVQTGIDWIKHQAQSSVNSGKPVSLTGFGLVTQSNLPAFTPFNSSQPFLPMNASTTQAQLPAPTGLGVGLEQGQLPVTDAQQQAAYEQWIQAAINSGVGGILQYQWGQTNLQPSPPPPPPSPTQQAIPFIPAFGQQQQTTPNDGYQAISPAVQNVLQQGALQQQIKNV